MTDASGRSPLHSAFSAFFRHHVVNAVSDGRIDGADERVMIARVRALILCQLDETVIMSYRMCQCDLFIIPSVSTVHSPSPVRTEPRGVGKRS